MSKLMLQGPTTATVCTSLSDRLAAHNRFGVGYYHWMGRC